MESAHDHKKFLVCPTYALLLCVVRNLGFTISVFFVAALVDFGIIDHLPVEEDAKLIESLLELHVSGKYGGADNGFKPEYLKAVQQLLDNKHNTGFGWDTDKCCVTADAEVWAEYIKDRATDHGATNLGEDVTEETQRNSHVDVEGLEEIVEETQQIARVNSKRKRPPTDDTESSYKEAVKEIKETFKEVGEKLNQTIFNIGR
ncbi:unnamed protein product [Lactuca saligna]|uniref:Myb/SANT-like domain-containing protein n=1 Tax=Lactuca saligna TaxID=75948 RepID=A0AA36A4J3_LACSI|nr:unnamed protein product [Lactuca saligna]